ncbi:MAG TPA: D-alanyl-D-alanine carboxypeptidase/D-alanyl-D-alanine-endopeptidase [Bacteroidetes bacterium]|nr:D-alanyl-D-alanine carboxypeptidase/D-alanyl-D-alanine-endopeptidase [Bacteroidota bacterium]
MDKPCGFAAPENEAKNMKHRMIYLIVPLAVLLVFSGCAFRPVISERPSTPLERLQSEFNREFNDPAFSNSYWGVAVQSLETGAYFYLRNTDKSFRPASNMKLFTTGTALVRLSPDFTYRTKLYRTGRIESGTLKGDLVIRGSGDPSITGRFHDGNILAVFQNWADSLKQKDIRKITGRVIGDDHYFTHEIMGEGWAWDYQSDWYAAQISALSFNDNCVNIIFTPGKSVGDTVSFRLEPPTKYVRVINKVVTAPPHQGREIVYQRERGKNVVVITGAMSIDAPEKTDWFSVENPTRYAATVFTEVLQSNGIRVEGHPASIDSLARYKYDSADSFCVASYQSPPLREIVKVINKVSQNLYAELLLRTLGKVYVNDGSARGGIKVVKQFLASIGIDPDRFAMFDGSGLSHLDMVTPKQVITLLRYLYRSPVKESFWNSLPIAGIDGSLKNRMKMTAAEGNVRAKTGYISNTRALSGTVTTKDGEPLVFSLIVNNYLVPTSMANTIQDWVCERLANFSRAQDQ